MVLVSIVLASQTFIFPRNSYQMDQLPGSVTTMVVACGGVMSAVWIMRKFLADSWLFRRLMLVPPSEEIDLERAESLVDWRHLIGKQGVTTTQLTPSGKARFGDDVINVISDGVVVPKDTVVNVIEVHGNRVIVESPEES
jgi:membrane-bound ClpP family serine protease